MTDMHIGGISGQIPGGRTPAGKLSQGPGFADVLQKMVQDVNSMQQRAGQSVESLAKGEVQDLHEVMIEMNKAEIGFRFLLEVRNKIVEAYQEVSRMPV